MQEKTAEILLKFYKKYDIEDINISDKRIIITIKDEDEKKASEVENIIREKTGCNRVNIILIKE